MEPDKDAIYICASSNYFRDIFHTFLCVNGKCAGLYPNPNFFKTGYIGEVRDDTADFDMFNKDGYCVKLYTKMEGCKEEQFKQCIEEFTYIPENMTRRDSHYPYNVITHNCRTIAGYVAIRYQIKSNCR